MSDYRCPYCYTPLTDADATEDGDALRCPDCNNRVEYFDALAAYEESVSCFAFPPTESSISRRLAGAGEIIERGNE